MTAQEFTFDPAIAQRRLANQAAAPTRFSAPVEAVRWMGALQGQDYHQASWAVAMRTHGATLSEVEQAFAQGELVRTWAVRGTLQVVAAEDAGWMTAIAAERHIAGDARRMRQLELTHDQILAAGDLLEAALDGGIRLTRPEVMALWQEQGIVIEGQRAYHILWHLAVAGRIVVSEQVGKQQSFRLVREWIPNGASFTGDEALGELAARYFASRGPATVQDLVAWSGLRVEEVTRGIAIAGQRMERWDHAGTAYWMGNASDAASGVVSCLLPLTETRTLLHAGFDEYMLGYRDRAAVLAPQHANLVVPGGNGIFQPFVTVDGEIVATWKRTITGKGVRVAHSPFDGRAVDELAIAGAARRYADFLGVPLLA